MAKNIIYWDQLKFWLDGGSKEVDAFLAKEIKEGRDYVPHHRDIYRAYNRVPPQSVKVLIMGQDPYPEPGVADGLAFSASDTVEVPRTLHNIFTEMMDDVDTRYPQSNNLVPWVWQGVMLLNSRLTRQGKHGPHLGIWEPLIEETCEVLAKNKTLAVVLWGKEARKYAKYFDADKHLIHTSPHPSPLSAHAGFFGSKPFSKVNAYLESVGEKSINWEL